MQGVQRVLDQWAGKAVSLHHLVLGDRPVLPQISGDERLPRLLSGQALLPDVLGDPGVYGNVRDGAVAGFGAWPLQPQDLVSIDQPVEMSLEDGLWEVSCHEEFGQGERFPFAQAAKQAAVCIARSVLRSPRRYGK